MPLSILVIDLPVIQKPKDAPSASVGLESNNLRIFTARVAFTKQTSHIVAYVEIAAKRSSI